MAEITHVLFLTQDDDLRNYLKPLAQWLDFHCPLRPIDALENIKSSTPDIFIIDAEVLKPMIQALLSTIRNLPTYRNTPMIIIGDSPQAKKLQAEGQLPRKFNLRRLEELIAEVLGIRLVGRGTHGPHHGSIY